MVVIHIQATPGLLAAPDRYRAPMAATLIDRLALRAMRLAIDAIDDDVAMVELRQLAGDNDHALEQAIRTCLAQPASLAARHRAIELLARVRYERAPPPS